MAAEIQSWQLDRIRAAAIEVADFFPAGHNEREIIAIAERALAGADGSVEVVPRSELERAKAEHALALKALGFDTYEAASKHITAYLSGPAPKGWPYGLNTLSAEAVSDE